MKILTKSARETQKLAENLAKKPAFVKTTAGKGKAVVLALVGNLGGGKTTFLQGFAKGLGIKEKINSPTFVIMKRFRNFYHFDCYRIQKAKEILDLGWKDIINNPKNIVAVEWADRIESLLPKTRILIQFETVGKNRRRIKIGL